MVKQFSLLALVFLLLGSSVYADKIPLTQAKMAELVIQKSLNLKETDLRYVQYRYAPFLVYGNYEWKWSI